MTCAVVMPDPAPGEQREHRVVGPRAGRLEPADALAVGEQAEERTEGMTVGEQVGRAPGDLGAGLVAVDGAVGPEERAVVEHAQEGDVGVDGPDPLPEAVGGHA